MDQCQTDDKLGIDIKDEVGEKCEVHGKKQSNFILKLNFGAKNQHLDTLLWCCLNIIFGYKNSYDKILIIFKQDFYT